MTDVETEFRRLGPYVLLRASGAGGMARIDLALRGDPDAADVCVLKRLHADYRSPEQEARFRREAAIARRLSHDAIARTLGIDEVEGELLVLQELVMGVDLRRLTARVAAIGERLPVSLAVYVVSEVARALDYAHKFRKLGIVHRDVTPDNIMLAFSGAVKLVDFGIARSNADGTLTQAGFVVGRPIYTAPEVWEGARADRRSDIYSLGVVLWQLLTGRPLEPGEAASSPSQINPDVPPAMGAVNLRAFDADPNRRYQSAGALRRALAPHLPRSFRGPARLSELLARHFDVPRERRMLEEDVAHAKPLLTVAEGPRPLRSTKRSTESATESATEGATEIVNSLGGVGRAGRVGGKSKILLVAAAGLVLFNVGLIRLTHRRATRTIAADTAPRQSGSSTGSNAAPQAAAGGVPPVAAPPVLPAPVPPVLPAPVSPAPVVVPPVASVPVPAAPVVVASVAAARVSAAPVPPTPSVTSERAPMPTPRQNSARLRAREEVSGALEPEQPPSPPVNVKKLLADAQQDFDRGELPAALTLARSAAHNGAGCPAYVLIGTIMMNERRYHESESAFAEATRLDPADAHAARLLAMVRDIRKMGDERQ